MCMRSRWLLFTVFMVRRQYNKIAENKNENDSSKHKVYSLIPHIVSFVMCKHYVEL